MTSGEQPPAIIRLTRFSTAYTQQGHRGAQTECVRWTVHGVDASGEEHIYVEHTSEDEHKVWCASDPLWREAQAAMIGHLKNPATRDLVLQVNIKAAIDSGDIDTAMKMFEHLSSATKQRLMRQGRDEQRTEVEAQ